MQCSTALGVLVVFFASNAFAVNPTNPDFNRDGHIDAADLDIMRAAFFSDDARADLNSDGRVDFADLALLKAASQGRQSPGNANGGGTPRAPAVFLQPDAQSVPVGEPISVDLYWDFTGDPTIGGGTDIMWDPNAFALVSIVFDDNFGTGPGQFDPAFTRCDDEQCDSPGLIDGLATGNFNGLADPGPILIATLTFDTLAEGSFSIDLEEDTGIAGPFVSAIRFDIYPDLEFVGADVDLTPGAPAPRILVEPSRIDYPDTIVGATSSATLSVSNIGTLPLEIESVAPPEAPFAISADDCTGGILQPAEACGLTVDFMPTAVGPASGALTVLSNAANRPEVEVPLTGRGIAAPEANILAPSFIPVGAVRLGQSAQESFFVRNVGDAPLEIGDIGADNALEAPFAITQDDCSQTSLAPGQQCAMQVTFNPTAAGPASGDFDIPSNDPDEPSVVVSVSGIGHPEVSLTGRGLMSNGARCTNRTTSQVVEAGLDGRHTVPCETGGLVVSSGDEIVISLRGIAEAEPSLEGEAFGLEVERARCVNATTGQEVTFNPSGIDWNCVTRGLVVTPGDTVSVNVLGQAL